MFDRMRAWWAAQVSYWQHMEERRNSVEDYIDGLGDDPDA